MENHSFFKPDSEWIKPIMKGRFLALNHSLKAD